MKLQTIKDNNKHNGPSSSKEFNKKFTNIHLDLAYLADSLNTTEEDIVKNMNVNMREKQFLQARISELELKIKEFLTDKENTLNANQKFNIYQSFYNLENISNNNLDKEALIDSLYGIVSPKIIEENSKFSYKTEDGIIFLPNGLEVNIKETDNISEKDEATNSLIYRDVNSLETSSIVDKENTSYWMRTVKYKEDQSVTEVFGEVHIKLPVSTLNNVYANTLYINPFPEGSMTIKDIFYKGLGEQWDRLPNYPTKEISGIVTPVELKNSKKMLFNFPRTEIVEIRIFYSQPYWIENQREREFTYGFQDIDLSYRNYSEKECEFVTTIDISNQEKFFNKISSPQNIAAICSESEINDLIRHQLYYDENLISEFEFGDTILAPINKAYIKTILKKEGGRIPVLKNLEFEYEEKEGNQF